MKIIDIGKKYRHSLLIFADIVIIICSYIAAILFLDINIISKIDLIKEIALAVLVYELFLNILQMYKNMMRYEIGKDYIKYMFICFISTISVSLLGQVLRFEYLGLRLNVLTGIFVAGAFVLYRLAGRSIMARRTAIMYKKRLKNTVPDGTPENVLIIGAGMGAREIIIAIKNSMKSKYNLVGIIDDNTNKMNKTILGVPVVGTRYDIPDVVKEKEVNLIFFAINRITPLSRKKIIEICQNTGVKTRVLPTTEELIEKQGVMNSLRDVEIEDLLGRDVIKLDNKGISALIKDRTVLVTGGGGSIGSELCRQIIKYNPKKLVILDIYENNLYDIDLELKANYPKAKIEAVVASVRDSKRMDEVFEEFKPSIVFHAAAHKHVPLMENNPLEAVKNNIFGTYNVVNSADKYKTEKFVLISTDKAVNPTNVMGASKRVCEMIVQAKNKVSKTEYVAVRFGNVLGSNGSVIPVFKKQIEKGGPVTVTHKDITRFFMTIPEAVGLILQAVTYANGGEIFVLDMGEPVKIYDLAVSLIKLSGYEPGVDIQIEFTGLRPGEKLYEELLMAEEGLTSTKHNKIFISKPMHMEMKELEEKLNLLNTLEYDEEYSRKSVKDAMKAIVPTYKEPEEVNG
ncbi:MAG: polysaccharide biosynthesis protein [Clostridia bacterium]|nr:polysaccharide biosynthesis protein [Clostridia bacterium]